MANIKDYFPYFFTVVSGLLAWLYSLNEKRINERANENKILSEKCHALELRVVKLESEQMNFSTTLKSVKSELKEHLDLRIDSLETLIKSKL